MEKERRQNLSFFKGKNGAETDAFIDILSDYNNEEVLAKQLFRQASTIRDRLPDAYPVYYYLEADMRYLAFLLFHDHDYDRVKVCTRICHDGKKKEVGVYVGNSEGRFYLYELLGRRAKDMYETAKRKENTKRSLVKQNEQKSYRQDPGYETDYYIFHDEEDEGLLYED